MTLSRALRPAVTVALVAGGVTVLSPFPAQAAAVEATLVATRDTSVWGVPSPDPSGITYNPTTRQLILSDGEVEETPVYQGTNIFLSSLDGQQPAGFPGGTSQPHSNEPVGVSYRPADGHLFISDDDADRVFEFVAGPDDRYGTSDDTVTSFSTRLVSGNGDAEDVTVDMDVTTNGHVIVVDGTDKEVFDYGPGPNGTFDAVAPNGDDTVTNFDVQRHGALDPEGIEFHPQRNTILVLDGATESIYELDRQGALLNVISIAAANPRKAAGMTLAPASNDSGAQNLYIVDRGVDNDSDPNQNDGRFYEMSVAFPPLSGGPANTAPSVSAGPDLSVVQPQAASLAGSVSDDGQPQPPGAVTVAWSKVSGPGDVTFANATAASTTATFTAAGSYVLRLTADDGGLLGADETTVRVTNSDGSGMLEVPVRAGVDDAEERSATVSLSGTDLELVQDGPTVQTVGLRFTGISVPRGATITNAYLQFEVDEAQTGPADLTIAGQAADDTTSFADTPGNISSRPRTSATVVWQPAAWPTVAARGVDQRTPNLSAIVQEIVARAGWSSGNAMAFVITGTGTRTAEAFEGEGALAKAPVLHIDYSSATTDPGPVDGGEIEQYVTKVYNDLFQRDPDPSGLSTWTNALRTGTSYGAVANGITYSREFRSRLIAASYQRYLGRSPDAGGLENWLNAMAAGLHIEQMQSGLLSSPESYLQAGSDDRRWIANLYQTVLLRAAGSSEIDFWQGQLRAGASRSAVALGFLYSTEYLTGVVDGYYRDLLRRGIDPAGQQTWVSAIQGGARDEDIIASIVSSAEYRQNV